MAPMNVVFASPRQANCGDEFILQGTLNLFRAAVPDLNPILFNKTPELWLDIVHKDRMAQIDCDPCPDGAPRARTFGIAQFFGAYQRWYDDSWIARRHSTRGIDAFVVAGTPEWEEGSVLRMYEAALSNGIPLYVLGVGVFEAMAPGAVLEGRPALLEAMKHASLITARDSGAHALLAPFGGQRRPCPALFAAGSERVRTRLGRIALGIQPTERSQAIDPAVFEACVAVYRRVLEERDAFFVIHHIDELDAVLDTFGRDVPVAYSFDARDYAEIYDQADFCLTTRVHGAGMSASLGIPSIVVHHSPRSDTVRDFGAEVWTVGDFSPDTVVDRLGRVEGEIEAWSRRIVEGKRREKAGFVELLTGALPPLPSEKRSG